MLTMIKYTLFGLGVSVCVFSFNPKPTNQFTALSRLNGGVFQGDATSSRNHQLGLLQQKLTTGLVIGTVSALINPSISHAEDGFTTTESGLKYMDIVEGTGEVPQPGQMVRVHYTGWLDDFESEKKFDSSYDRRQPLSFAVGTHQVISGWDEGLLTNLKVGGKRKLIIPPSLGYGKRGAGGLIPPNATLYFLVELVGIGRK
jgi:peptidylprolyl isomerase